MKLILETKNLSYIPEGTMAKGKNALAAEKDAPEGINGIKMDSDEVQEDGVLPGLAAAAAVPAAIIGWQKVRHKVGF